MKKILLFLLFFTKLSKCSLPKHTVAILIHGTWGSKSAWHQPNDPFYEELKRSLTLQKIKLINFYWSGKLSYPAREEASMQLASIIESYPANTQFIIIGHSHGSNVAILACQKLKSDHKICEFYGLGTPIDEQNYLPDMTKINHFYHIYSFGDIHQTVLGMHARALPNLKNIYNINLEIDQIEPQHEELHVPIVAKYLLKIRELISPIKDTGNHFCLKLAKNSKPFIFLDHAIKQKMADDLAWHKQVYQANLTGYSSGR